MGRDWLQKIRLDWQNVGMAALATRPQIQVEALLRKYPEAFKEGLGLMSTFEATLNLTFGSLPKYCKTRPVPFSLKQEGAIPPRGSWDHREGDLQPV